MLFVIDFDSSGCKKFARKVSSTRFLYYSHFFFLRFLFIAPASVLLLIYKRTKEKSIPIIIHQKPPSPPPFSI